MIRRLNIKPSLIALAACYCLASHIHAQGPARPEPIWVNGDNNETTKTELDLLAQQAGDNQLIITIARLGSAESARRLSRRRLQAVRDYLESVRAIARTRIISAEGERVRGRGRVEVYLGGKLFMVFTLGRNKGFAPEG
jgi:hypothetical protein